MFTLFVYLLPFVVFGFICLVLCVHSCEHSRIGLIKQKFDKNSIWELKEQGLT